MDIAIAIAANQRHRRYSAALCTTLQHHIQRYSNDGMVPPH
jgi:hypothetical protein